MINFLKVSPSVYNIQQSRQAELMLVLATFFWGWTFPVVKEALSHIPIFAFLGFRFALASILMFVFVRKIERRSWVLGIGLGILLFLSFSFQTWGLLYTSASKCAFITGLNIIWVSAFTARDKRTWIAVGLGIVSLSIMTTPWQGYLNWGDFLTLICSLFIALHLLALHRLNAQAKSGELACVQFIIVAVLSFSISFSTEPVVTPSQWNFDVWFALLLTALGATVLSFWIQTHFQRRTSATRGALIFILEPIFAALFAVWIYGEQLSISVWIGIGLIIVAMGISAPRSDRLSS